MTRHEASYDRIGVGYHSLRQTDPRIMAQIDRGLGQAESVVNIGAGTGSYEPTDRRVCGVEPSMLMLNTRPLGAAPALQGVAEALPFADQTFDAAMTVLSLHHWENWAAGLDELCRVSQRQVIVTFEPLVHMTFWLINEYFPAIADLSGSQPPEPARILEHLGGGIIESIPIAADCHDAFLWAFWNRPEAYLDPAVQASSSGMALLSDHDRLTGTELLRQDLESGAWLERHSDLIGQGSIDGGFRLVVGGRGVGER